MTIDQYLRETYQGYVDPVHDIPALRELAQRWREVSRRNLRGDSAYRDDDPGPHMTAIQLEWAAREIEQKRTEINELHSEARNAVAQRDALAVALSWCDDYLSQLDDEGSRVVRRKVREALA